MQFLTIIYIILFVFLMLTCYVSSLKKFYIASKMMCSAAFIGIAIFAMVQSSNTILFWRLFPAFIFCFMGDFFLALKEVKEGEKPFLIGLSCFLIGHILFLWGFEIIESSTWLTWLLPLLGIVMAGALLHLKYMNVGKFKAAVLVYSYFVTALFIKCTQTALSGDGSAFYWLIFCGGAFFIISDIIILFLYFYNKKYAIIKLLNLGSYYAAVFLLAAAILYK